MTRIRSVPGWRISVMGKVIGSLGNAFTVRYGSGGSGEPTTREVVSG